MCGPIAMMLPVDRNNQTRKVIQILTYHVGRISAYATIGIIFGLLGKGFFMAGIQQPCGMVYVALFGAIAMQSPIYGGFYMVLFGLGTIPMMSSVVYMNSLLSISVRNKIQKLIPIVVICIGILFILRGLGLGIPYVSPSNLNLFIQSEPNCR